MRIPLLAGNWKMHKSVAEARALAEELAGALGDLADREALVCPPFTALAAVAAALHGSAVGLGAQNMAWEPQGAFTGEIAPPMLRDLGCSYVILGHSERRAIFGEDDALVGRKVRAALAHDLRPILCVGETKAQRDAGDAQTVTLGQLRQGLADVPPAAASQIVVAYEPVWAIGTGDTATPADAQAMHAALRHTLAELLGQAAADAIRLLYGGSVKPDNVDELMAQPDIDGALVGGASLKAADFLRIVRFA